jgi:glycosyltransferase involved in cell wall biosynthesis
MATRKKVFLIVTKAVLGGAQRYVFDVARLLPKDSYDVTIYSGETGWLHEVCTRAGIPSVSLPSFRRDIALGEDARAFFDLLSVFKKEKPDIVHLNSSKIGALGALAARAAGIRKIVFTAHGWAFNEKRPAWQKALLRAAAWATVLLSDTTICVSESIRKDIAVMPFISRRLRVVHLGIEPFETASRDEARAFLSEKTGAKKETLWIGTIAELHKNKGIDIGIRAFSLLKGDAEWIIIGGGEEEAALKKLAHENPRIRFAGPLENARAYLCAFDAFLLPSRTEAFGGVLLEAGIAGIPAVATNAGGIAEVLDDGHAGLLFERENPEALAAEVRKMLADPTLRANYAVKLHARVHVSYGTNMMIAGTRAAYEGTPISRP